MTRTTRPLSPEECRAFRAIAEQHAPKSSAGLLSHQEALEPRSTIELLPLACLRLLDDLDEQKTLNADLHRGVCAGYAAILAERNQFERELKDLREAST